MHLPPPQPPLPLQRQQLLRPQEAAAPAPPLLAQCVAAEVSLARGACQLLSHVSGSDLAVAAAGSCLLLLRTAPGGVQPLAVLLECHRGGSISAVAVSSVRGQHRQWAAALEGSAVHFVPLDSSGADAACYGGSPSQSTTTVNAPPGAPGWQAAAWHPTQPVCAVLAPHELLLVGPSDAVGPGSGNGSGSDSDGSGSAAKDSTWASTARTGTWGGSTVRGDWGSLTNAAGAAQGTVLLALQGPGGSSAGAAAGRCCLAWLDGGGPCSDGSTCHRRLVVSWGGYLEVLEFCHGWQLHERRQLLPGLPGPVCSLAAAGAGRLLVTTERPVSQWLGAAEEAVWPVQPGVLQRGLTAARQPLQPLLLPSPTWPGSRGSPREPLHNGVTLTPLELQSGGITELTTGGGSPASDHSNPFITPPQPPATAAAAPAFMLAPAAAPPPAIPAMFMLQAPQATHMPLAEGLSSLPGASSPQQQRPEADAAAAGGSPGAAAEGGHAALLWLDDDSGRGGSPAGGSPREHAVQLGFAPDLIQVQGDVAVVSSSKAAPVLALCRLGRSGLRQVAAVQLSSPAGIPDSCTVRIRGLAVLPASGELAAAAPGDSAQLVVWVLLSAAQLGAAAPFFSAALSSRIYGSSKQQLWLSCYRVAVPGPPAPSSLAPGSSCVSYPLAAEAHGRAASVTAAALAADAAAARAATWAGPSTRQLPAGSAAAASADPEATPVPATAGALQLPGGVATAAAAAAAGSLAPGPAAGAEGTAGGAAPEGAVEIVLALQQAVADLRHETAARLDDIDAGLAQLLAALQAGPSG